MTADAPPNEIVLGHRDGQPVIASERGCVYSFGGQETDVLRYLCDLALHTAFSHIGAAEVWTVSELGLPAFPGLTVYGDSRALVSELEIEILKRHRMFDEEGSSGWESHQGDWPDDPLALVVGIDPISDTSLVSRFRAVAMQGRDLGIVVLAASEDAPLMRVVGQHVSQTGELPSLGPEPFESIQLTDDDRHDLINELRQASAADDAMADVDDQSAPISEENATRIRVTLFGRAAIEGPHAESGDDLGPKNREFLYLFLLNPKGLSRDEAIELLWPETEPDRGFERFKFQLRKVREHLRKDGTPTAKFIEKVGDVY